MVTAPRRSKAGLNSGYLYPIFRSYPQPLKLLAPQMASGDTTVGSTPKKAHAELLGRKQSIETELARQADLTKELETVNAQIQALDQTLAVFEA